MKETIKTVVSKKELDNFIKICKENNYFIVFDGVYHDIYNYSDILFIEKKVKRDSVKFIRIEKVDEEFITKSREHEHRSNKMTDIIEKLCRNCLNPIEFDKTDLALKCPNCRHWNFVNEAREPPYKTSSNNEEEIKNKIQEVVSYYKVEYKEYEDEYGDVEEIESLVNLGNPEAAIPMSELVKIYNKGYEDCRKSSQKIVYQYRYVCPICNYDYAEKEKAVECCGGDQ